MSSTSGSAASIKVGQIGTDIKCQITEPIGGVDTPVDLTTATLVQIQIKDPLDNTTIYTATVLSPASSGFVHYVDNVGIFNIRGRWMTRGIVTFSPTQYFPGSWFGFSCDE